MPSIAIEAVFCCCCCQGNFLAHISVGSRNSKTKKIDLVWILNDLHLINYSQYLEKIYHSRRKWRTIFYLIKAPPLFHSNEKKNRLNYSRGSDSDGRKLLETIPILCQTLLKLLFMCRTHTNLISIYRVLFLFKFNFRLICCCVFFMIWLFCFSFLLFFLFMLAGGLRIPIITHAQNSSSPSTNIQPHQHQDNRPMETNEPATQQ